MQKNLRERVEQILRMSVGAERFAQMHLAVMDQPFPEAMLTDQVVEVDVRSLDGDGIVRLTHVLVNNDYAVERVSPRVNTISHLRIWSLGEKSACRLQREALIQQILDFKFLEGWNWYGGSNPDPRDVLFELPQRLDDERTWAVGVRFGGPDSSLGVWLRGTLVMTFAGRQSAEVTDVAIYNKHTDGMHRMEPGKSFVRSGMPPVYF